MDRAPAALQATLAAVPARDRVVAVVQAAGQRIGIDGAHVVQAIEVPADLGAIPRRAGGIAGIVTRGDQLIPVVRLENWLDAAAPAAPANSPEARIVIVGDGERVVGLLVDAVVGMQRCAAKAIARLFHDDRPDELFACAARLDAEPAPLPLLEPARLAALAGTWYEAAGLDTGAACATSHAAAPATLDAEAEAETDTERENLCVFRIGDRLVGIAVGDIGEFVATPALRAPPLRHPTTRGLCDWRDRLLPVVDIGALIGAAPCSEAPAWMCVVRHGERVLGVLVHEIVELKVAELPRRAPEERTPLVRHALAVERGILHVLDTGALMAGCPESGISLREGRAEADRGPAATSPHTWLVFEADGRYATRIDHIQAIIPVPDALRPRLEAGLSAALEWRDQVVPVRALFAQAGRALAGADMRLLVVVVAAGRRVAVPITAVKAMVAPRTATLARLRARGGAMVDVVSTAAGPGRAAYEVGDLEALARAEQGMRQAA